MSFNVPRTLLDVQREEEEEAEVRETKKRGLTGDEGAKWGVKPMGGEGIDGWRIFVWTLDGYDQVTFVDGYVSVLDISKFTPFFKRGDFQEWNPSVFYFLQKAIFLVYMETNMWKNQDISKSAIFFSLFSFLLGRKIRHIFDPNQVDFRVEVRTIFLKPFFGWIS